MSAETIERPVVASAPAALPVTQRAANALKAAETEQQLVALVKQSAGIVTITNAAGFQECHAARMVLKNRRIDIEKLGRQARDDAVAFSKAVIAEERRLVAIIDPEETRLEAIQEAWTAAREAEKEEARKAEARRVAVIDDAIDAIRSRPQDAAGKSSTEIAAMIADLEALVIGETYENQQQRAQLAKDIALSKLKTARDGAAAQEAESQRLAAERAELAKQKAEQDEQARLQREQDQQRRLALEAEERKAAEADRVRREKLAADERAAQARIAEQERVAQAQRDEADRIAREKREAEEARLKAEREKLEAEQAAQRRDQEERDRQARAVKEQLERKAREKAEAEATAKRDQERKEQEAREAAAREERRKAAEILDGRAHLQAFVDTYGQVEQFAGMARAIATFLAGSESVAAREVPALSPGLRQEPAPATDPKQADLSTIAKPRRTRKAA